MNMSVEILAPTRVAKNPLNETAKVANEEATSAMNEEVNAMIQPETIKPILSPWISLFTFQKEVADLWRIALGGCRSLVIPSPDEVNAPNIPPQEASAPQEVKEEGESGGHIMVHKSRAPKKAKGNQSHGHHSSQQHGGKSAQPSHAKHTVRHPAQVKKPTRRNEKTSQTVLAGLRNRSLSAKSEALEALKSNKKFRTQKAMEMVHHLATDDSRSERMSELQSEARSVLRQSRGDEKTSRPRVAHTRSSTKSRKHPQHTHA